MKSDRVYLLYIMECIRRVQENAENGKEEFLVSHTIQDAILRNLHTMTETTVRLSSAGKLRHPEVDWRKIAAFRQVVVHDYFGIDLELVWEIVERDVPALKITVLEMLQENPGDSSATPEA